MSFGTQSIAAASTGISFAKVQSEVSVSLLKKTMDSTEAQATSLVQDMLRGVAPAQYNFDVWA